MFKKIILRLLVVIISMVLCGCTKNSKKEIEGYDVLEIKLSNKSSSYIYWQYDLTQEGIIDITISKDGICKYDVVDCGGNYVIYTIRPLKKGTVTINFSAVSGLDNTVYETAIYTIIVTDNNKIIEKHTGTYFD